KLTWPLTETVITSLLLREVIYQFSTSKRWRSCANRLWIAIQATNFGLKNDMIQQVQNSCQFHGLSGDDANKHLDKFLHVTQSIKVNGVTDDALRIYLFPHSLTHHATAWFDRFPKSSITTFEQMAKMFLKKYFPPSMVTKLRNEITNFRQRPGELLFKAWECYKLSIDRCPNHNMLPVTQIATFYNGLTLRHRDTINAAAGGTSIKRRPEECYDLIENMTAHHNDWDTSAQRTTVGQTQNVYAAGAYNQGVVERETKVTKDMMPLTNNGSIKYVQPPVVQVETQVPKFEPVVAPVVELVEAPVSASKPNPKPSIPYPSRLNDQKLREKANNQMDKIFQIYQDLNFNISFTDALILMPKFASTIKSFFTNKEKLFELARTPLNEHCSVILLKKLPEKLKDLGKFLIPCDFPGMDECLALANLGASINLMPLSVWKKLSLPGLSPTCMTLELTDRSISRPVGVAEDVSVKVGKFHFPADFVVVDFDADPRVPLILRSSFLKIGRALIDVYEGELTLCINRIDVIDVACEEYSQEVFGFSGGDKLPVIIAKDLKDEEKTALIKVLKSHKRALAWQLFDIKGINPEFYTHKILMEDDFKLAVQHQRRVNPKIHEEKSHFMVKEGIVFGHKISKNGIEVDKAKVDVIAKPPHPTTVKGVRSFLGHAGLYRQFIQDFSKIARPMTRLLEKDTSFIFSKECIEAFQSLNKKLTEAPILVALNWDLPFEHMCDASDFAIVPHGLPIFQITIRETLLLKECRPNKRTNFLKTCSITFGTTPSCLKCVRIKSSGGVFTAKKPLIFLKLATMDPPGDIMARTTPPKRCLTPVFINSQSIMMPMTWSNLVTLVNAREKSHNMMKCLKMPSKFARSLTCGASISWGNLVFTREQAYENSLIYKEKTKRIHDSKIKDRVFNVDDRVLLFNSRLNIFSVKLKTHWTGPFTVTQVFPYGTVELSQTAEPNFKVNGHRLKHYFGGDIPPLVVPDL
nr:reverse transcriptase domain-containing protein [Tanacetum cinerariifolium]